MKALQEGHEVWNTLRASSSSPGGIPSCPSRLRDHSSGHPNGDGAFDISDPINTLDTLFSDQGTIACCDAADSNDDGSLNISDAIHTLRFLFADASMPPDPGPLHCGVDPSVDDLPCEAYSRCN